MAKIFLSASFAYDVSILKLLILFWRALPDFPDLILKQLFGHFVYHPTVSLF